MEMIDMKLPPPKKEDQKKLDVLSETVGYDKYPWGLKLDLSTEIVDKLKAGELNVGDKIHVMAEAVVTSKSVNEEQGDKRKTRKNVGIQIQKMGFKVIKTMDKMSTEEFMEHRNKGGR